MGQLYIYSKNLQDIPEFLSKILSSTKSNNECMVLQVVVFA